MNESLSMLRNQTETLATQATAEPDVPAGDQPLIPTSPPLQKQQFSTSSRAQNSSRRQQGGSDGG